MILDFIWRLNFIAGMIEESETDEFKDHFKKNNRIREYTVHSSKIHTVAWNCEGRKLASGKKTLICIYYWYISNQYVAFKPRAHKHYINVIIIITCQGSFDKTVAMFTLDKDKLVRKKRCWIFDKCIIRNINWPRLILGFNFMCYRKPITFSKGTQTLLTNFVGILNIPIFLDLLVVTKV